MKVAVVGASGFVGVALVEYLLAKGIETVPLVGSTGNSWRFSSQGIKPRMVNVLDAHGMGRALSACTHVVNCVRGDDKVMLQGTSNLAKAALQAGVTRFVHLSSVAIYGDRPVPEATSENARTLAEKGSYGSIKLSQDEIVQNFAARGLSSIILCPPNILGPGSYFLLQILDSLLRRELPLADGGSSVCNTVDVRNLAHACFLALHEGSPTGDRYFITDDERVTWASVVDGVRAAAQITDRPAACTLAELRRLCERPIGPKPRLWDSVKHLVSSDVRQALRKDPLLAKVDAALRALVARHGSQVEDRFRLAIEGPVAVPHETGEAKINVGLSGQQLRGVWHHCDKAKAELGYHPVYSFAQSMAAFSNWLQGTRGMREPDWNDRKILFGYP
jgi:nucleoside-diphosphate-sugar epimerase